MKSGKDCTVPKSGSFICGGIFDLEDKEKKVSELEQQMEEPRFWEDQKRAQELISEVNQLRSWTLPYKEIRATFENIESLLPEASELGEEGLASELIEELGKVEKRLSELETRKMLSGEMDQNNCFLSINSGAGGTEACDWALDVAHACIRDGRSGGNGEWK